MTPEEAKALIIADIERTVTKHVIGDYSLKVGDKMMTPVGEGTITAIEDGSIFVSVPPDLNALNINFTVELVPPHKIPEPPDCPHCDESDCWCDPV
jgi:hypothetical protein